MYYHVWFATKQRKWLLQGEVEEAVKLALQDVATQHNIRLLECETMIDHVHLLLEATDGAELSRSMHLIKGASARRLLDSIPEIRMDAGISHFWQKRYGARPVAPAALETVRYYVQTQKERPDKYAR